MKGELLSIIEFMEKDRGLERGTVIEAIEQAIETAARKMDGMPPAVRVRLDPETGEISAFSDLLVVADDDQRPEPEDDEEKADVTPWWRLSDVRKFVPDAEVDQVVHIPLDVEDFGRISAQTAKQVIVQRIREAERENILTEYTQRVGDLVHGTVSRYERGNLIVDIGRTEALLPRREQSAMERYRQGDRVRALVLDVRDVNEDTRIPRVILSRANAGLIRRLFELEVPEIYDGIVEIKAIAREAGFRTKIAVVSHDPKIDSVGACVGVRGSRVKNIVQEVSGEKIDIVRWSENIEEFVANALQPVEIVHTFADPDKERILMVVPDDQISLAIGKSGQNIRLTSKLTGWKVDVVRRSEADRVAKEHGVEIAQGPTAASVFGTAPKSAAMKASGTSAAVRARAANIFMTVPEGEETAPARGDTPLKDVKGITPRQASLLAGAGCETISALLSADRKTLLAIPGMGAKTLDKIMAAAN